MRLPAIAAITALASVAAAVSCNTNSQNAQTNDAKTCADLLRGKAGQICAADPNNKGYPPQMCHQGIARVYGLSNNGQAVSTSCESVADAVDAIIAQCLNGRDGNGSDDAPDNGNFRIDLHG